MFPVHDHIPLPLVIVVELGDDSFFLRVGENFHHLLALRLHPVVLEDLVGGETQSRVFLEDTLEEREGFLADLLFFVSGLALQDLFVELCHIYCFEGHCAEEHRVEHNASTPNVASEALIALILEDLGCDVGGSTTLLVHGLTRRDKLGDAEVANLDISLRREQNIVQLDVSVQHTLRVTVG